MFIVHTAQVETAVAFAVILASTAVLIAALIAIVMMGYVIYAARSALTAARRLKRSTKELGGDVRDAFLDTLQIVPRFLGSQKKARSHK